MNYPRHVHVENSRDFRTFRFLGTGSNRTSQKIVQFTPTGRRGIYNLALGDQVDGKYFDDFSMNENGDCDKVLASVVSTVHVFLDRYPRRTVVFHGSTPARTRLYRRAVHHASSELEKVFDIMGLVPLEEGRLGLRKYEPELNYVAFLVRRKLFGDPPPAPP
ncbi:MAG: hypothetical protein RLZZ165_1684 [Bacteroidota bacterium]|jgi:hypothetical protein